MNWKYCPREMTRDVIPVLLACGVLLLALASCQNTGGLTSNTGSEVLLEPMPGSYLSSPHGDVSEVMLDDARISIVVCETAQGEVQAGDSWIEVSGRVTNHDQDASRIALWARGYDEVGAQVARTLEADLIPGQIGLELGYGETSGFTLHLNASDKVKTVTIYGYTFELELPPTPGA